jgi:hypothetical protein
MTTANPGDPEAATGGGAPPQPQPGRRPADIFANRLILSIRLTGLTIREFSEQAGLDDASVSNWTRGMLPRDLPGVCHAIAEAHDIELMWLLLGGPLLPARGRPVKRSGDVRGAYLAPAFRPTTARAKVRARASDTTRNIRRVVDRSQPVAA